MSEMREMDLGTGFIHPQVVNGRSLWMDSGLTTLIDKLQNGDPALGWEGDPRLALFMDEGDRWVLSRLEADGEYRDICKSRPGLPLDERLIMRLMEHDGRRGFDPAAATDEYRPQDQWTARDDEMRNALEKVYWGASKDLGVV